MAWVRICFISIFWFDLICFLIFRSALGSGSRFPVLVCDLCFRSVLHHTFQMLIVALWCSYSRYMLVVWCCWFLIFWAQFCWFMKLWCWFGSSWFVFAMDIGLVFCDGLLLCCVGCDNGSWFWCQHQQSLFFFMVVIMVQPSFGLFSSDWRRVVVFAWYGFVSASILIVKFQIWLLSWWLSLDFSFCS